MNDEQYETLMTAAQELAKFIDGEFPNDYEQAINAHVQKIATTDLQTLLEDYKSLTENAALFHQHTLFQDSTNADDQERKNAFRKSLPKDRDNPHMFIENYIEIETAVAKKLVAMLAQDLPQIDRTLINDRLAEMNKTVCIVSIHPRFRELRREYYNTQDIRTERKVVANALKYETRSKLSQDTIRYLEKRDQFLLDSTYAILLVERAEREGHSNISFENPYALSLDEIDMVGGRILQNPATDDPDASEANQIDTIKTNAP
jgi:hypothetical protein